MSVHYKFKSALDYDTVTFDGLHISVGDLKAAISQQKRIGKSSDFDLKITNAQTKEVYVDDVTLIPKNTSLLVVRVPLAQQPKKQWEGSNNNNSSHKDVAPKGLADLSRMEGSEQDKINAMISQSTFDYDPSNYQKIRGQNQRGVVPANYTCYKCQKQGHWIKDCPLANSGEAVEIRRSTGIPRSFMVPVEGPKAPGAMMTPTGTFAVPVVDREAYLASESAGGGDTPSNAPAAPETAVPDELICSLCRDLLTDAVMIPCCGNSFCDECIRGALLESEDHECPDCREKEIAPMTLIPNRFLRSSVSSFRNQTGYSRRMPHRPSAGPPPQPQPVVENQPPAAPPSNGPSQPANAAKAPEVAAEESDGSADDNVTVTVPHPHVHRRRPHDANVVRYGPPPVLKPPGIDTPPNVVSMARMDEQRASTPTIDERRDPMSAQVNQPIPFNRGPPPQFMPGVRPRFNNPPFGQPRPGRPFDRFPPEPYQPPPPGIKDSPPNGHGGVDPLEAFNRMIREKEMRAKRREEARRRGRSVSRSPSPRSPRSPRSLRLSRSPRPSRSPLSPRSPRPHRAPPPRLASRSPRGRPRSPRYSRSRSISRGRLRRSPWSPRRRRTRDRSLSLTRSLSPRRRHRSPMRYRSPLRSPLRSPMRSPLRSPMRSPLRSPLRSPIRSPRRLPMSPRPNLSPHRFSGVYDQLLSPPRRSVEPPYGARYGNRNGPPAGYSMGAKPTPLMHMSTEPPPGYRGRYDGPHGPPFDDIPPGVNPPVPGFEPSPFEKQPFGPPGQLERERPLNYREPFRAPFNNGPPSSSFPIQNEIPVHVGEQTRYRDNFRPGHPFREQPPVYRDGQPFRDPRDQRGAPQFRDNSFRNHPYRDHREGAPPFRQPSADPREPGAYHDPNFRDENGIPRELIRPGYRPSNHSRGSRRNPIPESERHREREMRDREKYEGREFERRSGYDKREDRNREYDRNRDYDKERDYERSPKRREVRDRKRSESRGRSKDRDSKREKKDEKLRDKSSPDKKDKEKKIKDKKKKKKEKEKDTEKKKKREKKEKKDKESIKKEDEDNVETKGGDNRPDVPETEQPIIKKEKIDPEHKIKEEPPSKDDKDTKPVDDLYGEEAAEAVDKQIIENYVKQEDPETKDKVPLTEAKSNDTSKEEPFDGIELQVTADELDLKVDGEISSQSKEILAPLPGLSKWEVDDDNVDKAKEPGEITPDGEEDETKVTSEVIKRAENAIFTKVGTVKPIEIKKISNDRVKLYRDNNSQPKSSIQITVPVTASEQRSIEINERKRRHSKTPPPKLSVKERLGGKVEDVRRTRESRVVQSTVELVKSRSKTPKKEQPYRRVTVGDKANKQEFNKSDRRVTAERPSHDNRRKDIDKKTIEKKYNNADRDSKSRAKVPAENTNHDRERKKSTLDEAQFEPDYDETVESESDDKNETKKQENSDSLGGPSDVKKPKIENETIQLDLSNVKKKPDTESESSSDSDDTSSSSSSDARKRKKKKKRSSKKKRKRAASDSGSDSGSSSDDHKKKKKKRKHKKKSNKKKKKSKHKN